MEATYLSSFLDVGGLSIRYWSGVKDKNAEVKRKPSVVLFHGNAFSLDNWITSGTLELLSKEGFDVFAVDLPAGRGSKSSKVEKKKIQDYVPILEGIFAKLRVGDESRPVVLIGPSMGGGFALAYSIAHPEAVSALVLISPSIRSIDEASLSALEMPVLLLWGDRD
ncbi:MAG: alpha/beta fold hydrolase, partial [Nitrososphaerales archaeon]